MKGALPLGGLALFVGAALWGLCHTPVTHAQSAGSPSQVCHASMIIDRSGSVGAANEVTIRNQIQRLFQPTGLYDDKIQLAFWSFSNDAGNTNYDAPFYGYVSSHGSNTGFTAALNSIVSNGNTNYQQAFTSPPSTWNAGRLPITTQAALLKRLVGESFSVGLAIAST